MMNPLASTRLVWLAMLLSLLSNPGCHHLRFQEAQASPKPPQNVSEDEKQKAHWASLAAQGRAAFRSRDLDESERAYLASLAATSHLEASDARVTTAIDNVGRLAAYYQKIDEPKKAAPLVEVLAKNAKEGRKGEFESSSVPMVKEAQGLSEEKNFEAAARLYRLSLTLIGVDKRVNRAAKLAAQWNLMEAYIEMSQIPEAQEQMQSVSEEIKRHFGPDSRQALGLSIPKGQIQVANGDIASAEESYLTVIDSNLTSSAQKIRALDFYIDLLKGLDREEDVKARSAQLDELRKQTPSTGA